MMYSEEFIELIYKHFGAVVYIGTIKRSIPKESFDLYMSCLVNKDYSIAWEILYKNREMIRFYLL